MFNLKKLYRIESGTRVYLDDVGMFDMFASEILINFNNHINLGYKIYYLCCKSKYNFSLTKEELEYLYKENSIDGESLYYFFSENIKFVKCLQKQDLFFLTNLKNLGLVILIPKLDENNKYYFNLVLGVKEFFDIEQFNKWDFKSICVCSYTELNQFNLCENYLSKIFDIENNKFKNYNINKNASQLWVNELIKIDSNPGNSKFSSKGRRIYKKMIFNLICFHMYWLDDKSQLFDSLFQIDYGYKEKILIPDINNEFQIIESYQQSSLLDLIGYNREYFCFNFWKIYKNL
jgi:hypothetical protein